MGYSVDRFYHLYNRGNNRGPIFFNQEHRRYFIQQARRYFEPAGIALLAHCLMENHFHFVVKVTRKTNVSNAIRSFSCSYVKSVNKQLRRCGHLYQGDTRSEEVASGSNLLYVLAYIHANPVMARLVAAPQLWRYSDYQE